MGNVGSSHSRRRHANHRNPPQLPSPQAPLPPPPPEINGNRYVFATATPYPPQYTNPNPPHYYPHSGYYQPPPSPHVLLSAPFDHHHRTPHAVRYPCGTAPPAPTPYVEHQRAVTIRNDVNLKKETLRVEPDEENPGKYLVAFTFDATVAGSITIIFFAKEGVDCNLTSMKESLEPVTFSFKQGLGQEFRQPAGTGIELALFNESELMKDGVMDIFPLAVKAEASPLEDNGSGAGTLMPGTLNSQITQAIFEKKEKGEYQVRVVKQILFVNGKRYELQEIYGIGNLVESEFDGNDPGKECVICLSEPRDTTVLPCRHMCMCSGCAKVLRFQTNRCPICRQPVERFLEIKVNSGPDESVMN